jgi:hypothetical protein
VLRELTFAARAAPALGAFAEELPEHRLDIGHVLAQVDRARDRLGVAGERPLMQVVEVEHPAVSQILYWG